MCVLNKTIAENQNVGMKIHALQQNFCAEALDKAFFFFLVPHIVSGVLWGELGVFQSPPFTFL